MKFFYLAIFLLCVGCSSPSIVATQAIQRGDVANNKSNYTDAINAYEEYLTLCPQLGLYRNFKMEGSVNRKLGHAYATQGKFQQAIKCINKAIKIDSVNGFALEYMDDYRQLGMTNGYLGNYSSARKNLKKSLVLNEGLEKSLKDSKRSTAADTYLSLAQLEMTLGNYTESKELCERALSIYNTISGGHVGIIEVKLIQGIIAREMGQLPLAEQLLGESQGLALNNKLNVARQLQAIGEIHFLKGDPENAIRFKLKAMEEAERSGIKPQIVVAYIRMGDAYQRLGDQTRARFYYQKATLLQTEMESNPQGYSPTQNIGIGEMQNAYSYQERSGSSLGLALVSMRLGDQYLQSNKLDSANEMFTKAKNLFSKIGSDEGTAKANIEMAKVSILKKSFSEAASFLREAEQKTTQADLRWKISLEKGIVSEGIHSYDSALLCYKKSISIIDDLRGNISIEEFKSLFANDKVVVYDKIIMLLVTQYKQLTGYSYDKALEESFLYNEQSRSRSFLDMMGNHKIEPKNSNDVELLNREQLLKVKIKQLVSELNQDSQSDVSRGQLNRELEEAQQQYNNLLQEIKLKNESYATLISVSPASIKQVQSTLDLQTALVEYWLSENSTVTWVITKNKVEGFVLPIEKEKIQREVRAARKAISLRLTDVAQNSLKQLYEYLVEPVTPSTSGFKNLTIVPHRDLHFLPFQALQSKTNRFLIEDYVLQFTPSASVRYYGFGKENYSANNQVLGLALGDLAVGDFSGLPGTEIELNQLTKLYPTMDFKSKENCSETYLKQNGSGKNYIHLATHGVLNKTQPLYSYLLMSSSEADDGRLTVNEIFDMHLQSKLVTLSACDTGLGDIGEGDELVGLSRAFIYAGAQAVVVSLWQVDDATTAWLMTRFYQYSNAGFNSTESLTFAQRDIIHRTFASSQSRGLKTVELSTPIQQAISGLTTTTARDPYYWAPFILIGNGFVK